MRGHFVFSAIVGQDRLKTAYLANIVNPRLGGLLISGPKGTGKSTVVHSVTSILPDRESYSECPFSCSPLNPKKLCSFCGESPLGEPVSRSMRVVNLPLSCTEDRLIGTVDIEKLLKDGEKKVQPGILGDANGNILYIDEVNLLPDHLIDDILDVAASGWNTIEREGLSVSHPAEFILVGTMNPEEGELRPQILDRFPLCVKPETVSDPSLRVEIVKRNILFEDDPDAFAKKFEEEERQTAKKIIKAKSLLPDITIGDSLILAISSGCAELKVDGQRPDIVITKTAGTLAALDGKTVAEDSHVLMSAELALVHRVRDGGLLEPPTKEEIYEVFSKYLGLKPGKKPALEGTVPPSSPGDVSYTKEGVSEEKKSPLS